MAPAKGTAKAPALRLSKLNCLALKLAVYASQGGSPHHHARLASRCWLRSPGQAWLPAGFRRKVSRCLLHLSPLSQAYLAQSPLSFPISLLENNDAGPVSISVWSGASSRSRFVRERD